MVELGLRECNRMAVLTSDRIIHANMTNCTAVLGGQWMRDQLGSQKPTAVLSMLCHSYGQSTPPSHALEFIDWLINHSPWSDGFLSRSAQQVLDDKCFIANPEAPSNILIGGLIASRVLWEYREVSRAWHELVKRGVNPSLAFLLGHKASFDGGLVSFRNNNDGHKAIYLDKGEDYTLNFIKGEPKLLLTPYRKDNSYEGISATWGGSYGDDSHLKSLCERIGYTNTGKNNIFACAIDSDDKMVSVSDGFDQLAAIAKEQLKEWGMS